MTPFCDYLNVSVPLAEAATVRDQLLPLLDGVGASKGTDGIYRLQDGGSFKDWTRGAVQVFSISGAFIARLRVHGFFCDYLSTVGMAPHRVTLLHAALDLPVDAPPFIEDVYTRAIAGQVSLTRKGIKPSQVKQLRGPGADGRPTGTVYLGNRRNADVWAKVYDKRQERIDRGYPDPGPTVRLEVAVQSDVGATLRDAADPCGLFYNFASPDLLPLPADAPPWQSHAVGYFSKPLTPPTTGERLARLVEFSPDVARLVSLCRELGPGGFDLLTALLRRRVEGPDKPVALAAKPVHPETERLRAVAAGLAPPSVH